MVRTSLITISAIVLAALTWFALAQRGDNGAAAGSATSTIHRVRSPHPTVVQVDGRAARPVTAPVATAARRPAPDPCAGNHGKEVLVSLARQHEWLCDGHDVHASFAVTTGRHRPGDRTPTGTYAVQALTRNTTLDPSSGGSFHVKYWIPFKLGIYGFHDAPWQTIPFGSARYTTSGSQGCVHMRTHDIAELFHWVQLGTRVRVVRN